MKQFLCVFVIFFSLSPLASSQPFDPSTVYVPSPTISEKADPCASPTKTCMIDMVSNQPCVGGPGDEVIIGSEGDDVISGGGGNDRIIGGSGNDTICGGPGDDILLGEDGDDILYANEGSDVLSAHEGYDICVGGSVDSNCESTKAPEGPKAEDLQLCSRILGRWHWFDNGSVIFNSDNTVQWYTPITFQKGHSATWSCDPHNRTFTIPWTNGFTDVMSIIADGSSLQGKNNRGMTIWAQRNPTPSPDFGISIPKQRVRR